MTFWRAASTSAKKSWGGPEAVGEAGVSDGKIRPPDHPTDAELEILELIGHSNCEIAGKLRLSKRSATATHSQLRE